MSGASHRHAIDSLDILVTVEVNCLLRKLGEVF